MTLQENIRFSKYLGKEMPKMAELAEFICSPYESFGYYPNTIMNQLVCQKTYQYALNNFAACIGWRTDFEEFSKTIGQGIKKRILKSS